MVNKQNESGSPMFYTKVVKNVLKTDRLTKPACTITMFATIYITMICECHVRLLGLFNHLPKAETKNTTDTDAGTAKPALYQLYTEC